MPVPDSERLPASKIASHLGVMVIVAALMGLVTAGLVIPFAGVVGIGARDVARSMDDLPAELETKDLAQKTQILDSRGNTIATLYDENRINVPLSQISPRMIKAIVAIEDYRFYQHGALDLKGTLRALVTNQMAGGTVQGGSSITQQLVKLTLVDQADTKAEQQAATVSGGMEGYARKIKELRYAIALEKQHSKDWILERYLNIAYFGDGAYGIQAAAKHYFDVNAKDLSWKQAAMLAGMVKNPTSYDPTNNEDRARTVERRNVVLQRMADLSVFPQKKAEKLKASKLGLKLVKINNGCVFSAAPFFCQYARAWLLQDPDLGETVKEREQLLNSGGLTIHTTIDLRYQRAADKSVAEHVYAQDQAIGALAMVEPRTGHVKAVAQSRPMGNTPKTGETYLNYVVPKRYGNANGFQAGSTFKAFVLAAAIKQGIPLSTTIPGPMQMTLPDSAFKTCSGAPYAGDGGWTVGNSTGDGSSYNLYSGTQQSINTFYAQLEARTGLCQPWKLAARMGINLPDHPAMPAWVLGVTDTSPLELAEAYATFAGRGLHCSSLPVTKIENPAGEVVKEYKSDCQQVIPSAVADAVNDVLRGVMEPGGFGSNLALSVPSAGKTGTINGNMAVWFMGYTPELSTAAMIAGADRRGNWITLNGQYVGGSPIYQAFGSTVAGPMWADAMKVIDDYLDDVDFTTPSQGEIAGFLTEVPYVSGMTIEAATARLEAAGFKVAVGSAVNDGLAEGLIVYSSPSAGSDFGAGDTITIYPSTGYVPPPPPEKKDNKKKKDDKPKNGGGKPGKGNGGGR